MVNDGGDLGVVTLVTVKATGEYLAFSNEERLQEYMQEHNLSEDDYDIYGLGCMDAPFYPDREKI